MGNAYGQQTLTLEECRGLAIRNNRELRISKEKVTEAGYDKKAAFTKYFPSLSATGAYLWNQKDIRLFDTGKLGPIGDLLPPDAKSAFLLDIQNIWIGGISLVQPVFMGGKIINYNLIAGYAKELAGSMNDLQLQHLIVLTDEAYWQIISLVNKKKLADAYVSLLRKMDGDVAEMIREGVATQADGLSVKVRLNEAEVAQTKVENGLALSRMALAQLCGLPLDDTPALADENIDDFPSSRSAAAADINEAFANRNELKSLDLAFRIYQKRERLVLADMLPNVAFVANYLVTNPNSFNGFQHSFGGMLNMGVMVNVPLSGWWEGTYRRNSARAATLIRKLEYEAAREKIALQVNQSVYKANEARKRVAASLHNMENAKENLRHATFGFEEGVIPALNLMEAQTAWVAAHSELIDAQIEAKLTDVYLGQALGRPPVATEEQHKNNR
jgi:outer membrane protein TolC